MSRIAAIHHTKTRSRTESQSASTSTRLRLTRTKTSSLPGSTGRSTRRCSTCSGSRRSTSVWVPWESIIPSLLSHRIDTIGADIHVTAERLKVISFSGPAWWYGPVLIVQKGNPLNITSYDQLKGKKVGAITGSAADLYLRRIGVQTNEFKQEVDELQSLNQGRLDAVLEEHRGPPSIVCSGGKGRMSGQ